MKRILLLQLTFVLLLIPCLAQDIKISQDKTDKVKQLDKVIKQQGWNIPILEDREATFTKTSIVENYPITIQGYELKKPVDMQFDYYALRIADNYLISSSRNVEVKGFIAYIAEGKTFAYKFYGVVIGYTEEGYKVYAGAILTTDYVDEDGDGKFETCYLNSSNKNPDKIPDWIAKDKNKIIKPIEKPPAPPPFKKVS